MLLQVKLPTGVLLWEQAFSKPDWFRSSRLPEGVVVLFVQIGALCSENPLHDKHLRFQHFRTLHIFRADWCASW
ncbi:MAG: hypothetical protein AB7U92_00005, partial [Piscinibacter sp.]|uniref:hypothetical protein n=1 Tax=Piscinibacter sp. TaxID=1903157 RepID=UPI003D0DECA1